MTDFSRRGKANRRKGARGELEVRDLLRTHGWTDTRRNFQSGGQGGGDLTEAIPDWHLEIKNVHALNLNCAWRQANHDRRPTDSILIAHHGPYQPWLATILHQDLIALGLYGWSTQVLSPRQSVRAELMARLRSADHPLMLHTVCDQAVATGLLNDFLTLIRLAELARRARIEEAA
jgi:hypothetical protein